MNAGLGFTEQLKSPRRTLLYFIGERSGADDAENRREGTMMVVRVLMIVRIGVIVFVQMRMLMRIPVLVRMAVTVYM
jgi:hypothetical protein